MRNAAQAPGGVQADFEDYRELYDVLRNTPTRAFDVSMYLGVREADPEHLRGVTDAVSSTARRAPTNLLPIMPRWQQLPALQSVSPLGVDALSESMDTTTPMLGGALGAMYPFVSGAFSEPGIEYGTYALNESPLVVDRFERETGYCMLVIGQLGAGKSFSTKLQLVRRAMYDPDTILVMLDPLEGFASVNDALGGERITVGAPVDSTHSKPRLHPGHHRGSPRPRPWAEQVAWVLGFFETFFQEVAMNPWGVEPKPCDEPFRKPTRLLASPGTPVPTTKHHRQSTTSSPSSKPSSRTHADSGT